MNETDEAFVLLSINKAGSWNEFKQSISQWELNPLIFTYADRNGNIGVAETGTNSPRSSFNPDAGFITDSRLPGRADMLLSGMDTRDMRSIKRMQSDIYSIEGVEWKALIAAYASNGSQLYPILEKWDGLMKAGSGGAAAYAQFIITLAKVVLEPKLGEELFIRFSHFDWLIRDGLIGLFQGNRLTADEKKAYLDTALENAGTSLGEMLGSNQTTWSWGALHSLTFRHILGRNSLLSQSLNRGPFPLGGNGSTLFENGAGLDGSHEVQRAALARLIMDTGSPDNSTAMLAPGQSGHALDEHYRDQIQLFLGDMVHATLMDTAKIRRSGWKRLLLQPEYPVR